jgi:hypothetical protein
MLAAFLISTFSFGSIWFPIHWMFNAMGVLLMCIGFVVVVVEVSQRGSGHFDRILNSPTSNAHPILGMIIVAFVLVQALNGLFAHLWWKKRSANKQDTSQPTWLDYAHRWFGRFVLLLAFVQIFLGVAEARLRSWVFGVYGAWFAFVAIIVLMLLVSQVLEFRTLFHPPPKVDKSREEILIPVFDEFAKSAQPIPVVATQFEDSKRLL